jgi:hypothetical protein
LAYPVGIALGSSPLPEHRCDDIAASGPGTISHLGGKHGKVSTFFKSRLLATASKLLAEQYQSVLEEIKPAVSEAVFERLNESIRRHQELLERLQRENKLLRELRRLELLEKYDQSPAGVGRVRFPARA